MLSDTENIQINISLYKKPYNLKTFNFINFITFNFINFQLTMYNASYNSKLS